MASSSLSTHHLYYTDTYLFTNIGRILHVSETEFNGHQSNVVILNQTVMHPQGGNIYVYCTSIHVCVYGCHWATPT